MAVVARAITPLYVEDRQLKTFNDEARAAINDLFAIAIRGAAPGSETVTPKTITPIFVEDKQVDRFNRQAKEAVSDLYARFTTAAGGAPSPKRVTATYIEDRQIDTFSRQFRAAVDYLYTVNPRAGGAYPSTLASLTGWWRSTDVVESGGVVSQLTDLTGFGRHWVGNGVYTAVCKEFGSYPGVDFDNGSSYMTLGESLASLLTASGGTLVLVVRPRTATTSSSAPTSNGAYVADTNGVFGVFEKGAGFFQCMSSAGALEHADAPLTYQAPCVLVMRHRAGEIRASVNGEAEATVSAADLTNLSGTLLLGKSASGTFGHFRFVEGAFYARGLLPAEVAGWVAYAELRYSILRKHTAYTAAPSLYAWWDAKRWRSSVYGVTFGGSDLVGVGGTTPPTLTLTGTTTRPVDLLISIDDTTSGGHFRYSFDNGTSYEATGVPLNQGGTVSLGAGLTIAFPTATYHTNNIWHYYLTLLTWPSADSPSGVINSAITLAPDNPQGCVTLLGPGYAMNGAPFGYSRSTAQSMKTGAFTALAPPYTIYAILEMDDGNALSLGPNVEFSDTGGGNLRFTYQGGGFHLDSAVPCAQTNVVCAAVSQAGISLYVNNGSTPVATTGANGADNISRVFFGNGHTSEFGDVLIYKGLHAADTILAIGAPLAAIVGGSW